MADTAMTTALEMNNAFREIDTLAQEVQSRTREIRHLLAAIDDASDDLCCRGEVVGDTQMEASDRILVFCRLALEAARSASHLGEQIERTATVSRQAAMSSPIREEETA